ncbi:unnamed protein product, partial [Mesorhabditis belari]|uniref:Globin family profile domain-containing protein n=1 Tax=Mesorhabditis belari TaxID=2138241 RepID=A0AAF3E9X0_9BILA
MGQKGSTNGGGIKISSSLSVLRERLPEISTLDLEDTLSIHETNTKPILNPFYRELVVECFAKAHPDIAARIIQRASQHRKDVKCFFQNAGNEVRIQFREVLSNYLREIIQNVDDADIIRKLSLNYGKAHVSLRLIGFKPDFFAVLADSITSECVFMGADATNQTSTNTFKAWTQLVAVMFSSVRDGYYSELRKQRRQTPEEMFRSNYKQSVSMDSSGSSGHTDDSGVGSHEGSCNLRSHSPSPLCSPMSANPVPRKQSAPVLGRQTTLPISVSLSTPRGTPKSNPKSSAQTKADLARKAYSGARSQTAITPASSTEFLDKSTGFYRTTHHSHDLPIPPRPPVSGRFQKNSSLDMEAKRKRFEELSRKGAAHAALSRHKSSSASSIFDPNSVIDRFMNDQL